VFVGVWVSGIVFSSVENSNMITENYNLEALLVMWLRRPSVSNLALEVDFVKLLDIRNYEGVFYKQLHSCNHYGVKFTCINCMSAVTNGTDCVCVCRLLLILCILRIREHTF